ncbi:MAG: hypothetical protein GY862_21440, partial [Gammaproteobacteria bacterium]|nr:hypothetical protein [Gammaproteobacteria bacterium]
LTLDNLLQRKGYANLEAVLLAGVDEAKAEGRAEGRIEGKAEGEVEGRKKTAINLLKMGVGTEIISQATGFSEEEIKLLTGSVPP